MNHYQSLTDHWEDNEGNPYHFVNCGGSCCSVHHVNCCVSLGSAGVANFRHDLWTWICFEMVSVEEFFDEIHDGNDVLYDFSKVLEDSVMASVIDRVLQVHRVTLYPIFVHYMLLMVHLVHHGHVQTTKLACDILMEHCSESVTIVHQLIRVLFQNQQNDVQSVVH